jgi:phosphopantothenoylcysteine decarboxylase/phosphopantothenate--cysteine ligase
VLGVSGGIAAYKAVEVCRRLVDAGAHVAPVLTEDATRFVGALTFSALASEPARTSLFDSPDPIPHTRLGQTADLVLVAPATAKLIGKYAAGISDDLLTATLLATRAPVLLAPAMHTEMWEHAAVQENLAVLRRRGVAVVDPESGRLAGGDVGEGRLAEPARIVAAAEALLSPGDLSGTRVLITAGGTREPIDPVRFIGNRSSGKMGYALAAVAARRGASVCLVTTVRRPLPPGAVEEVRVETAAEMAEAVAARFPEVDVVVMAAAVADFRPKVSAPSKLKKAEGAPEVILEPTPDILAGLGSAKQGQFLVGFAAETEQLVAHATAKLAAKRVDLMVANDVSAADSGFEVDTNRALLITPGGDITELPRMTKTELAEIIWDRVREARS